jgi:hypothetical protein
LRTIAGLKLAQGSRMARPIHPAASHNLPSFITAPGETDVLMVVVAILSVLAVLLLGVLFFRLHHLPEHIAHKSQKVQYEIVAVLGLIAMFTHKNIFWVAGLLLALVDLPDFGTPLRRIAGSTEKMAGLKPSEGLTLTLPEIAAADPTRQSAGTPRDKGCREEDGVDPTSHVETVNS